MNSTLKKGLKYLDYFNPPIIQFSPIRSGSTLVYNILRELFPKKRIIKRHRFETSPSKRTKYIITYRHPIDCLTSSIKRYDAELNLTTIEKHITTIKENGFDDLIKIFDNTDYLKLKYEIFHSDFDYIFNELESFFNLSIDKSFRDYIKKEYNADEVIKKTAKFERFGEFDKENFFHGKHISETKGTPDSYKSFFNTEQLEFIEEQLSEILTKTGYR